MNLTFHSIVIEEVEVTPERQALYVALAVIRARHHNANACLNGASAGGSRNSLTESGGCHTEEASETAQDNLPPQQGALLKSKNHVTFHHHK
jgi:hypothetical protein